MATYVLPQTLVFQDLTIQPAVAANPQSAHISGGHAFLVRESEDDERENGNLGLYDDTAETSQLWPKRPAGAVIDEEYTKVFVENALLRYFSDDISSGSNITVVSGYNNRIRSDSVNFTSNGAFARDASLQSRDVQVGDVIRVRGVPTGTGATGDPVTLWTYVKALLPDQVAAVIGAASTDADNAATQAASVVTTKTAGPDNCIQATADGSAYDGLEDGQPSETYTVRVLDSSVGGDLTTARLRVFSASGTDDVAEVIPAAISSAFAVGTRGLTLTFSDIGTQQCIDDSNAAGISPTDLLAGQEWMISVTQDFTATTATSGGSYDDTRDTTYIVTVTKGGSFADGPEISVTTSNGIDQSGPHVVSGLNTAIPIGTEGVTIEFAGSAEGLNKGDRFYVEVQGVSDGPVRTIELGKNLDVTYAANDAVGIDLHIRKPLLEISRNREGFAPLVNWEQSETEITLKPGIIAADASWRSLDTDEPLPLAVYSSGDLNYGVVYVEYRAWLPDLARRIGSISDVAFIDDISGPLTPDNPLKWGVFKALSNSNGVPVLYTAVNDPNNLDDWDEVLEILLSRDDAYELVPLTRDGNVLSLFQAHVNSASAPTEGLWRVAWFNLEGVPEIPIVHSGSSLTNYAIGTTTDGEPAMAVFEDDPETSGTQYTILRVPSANSNFLTNDVRPGDIVRGLYTGDGFGNFVYDEFVVDEVQSENQLRVKTGPAAPQSVPSKIEIWRNLSAGEEAREIGRLAGSWNDRRIRAVWPDKIESAGTVQEGYHLCAALAGLASGVLPHQGLTRVSVSGFSSVQRTNDKFNKAQLNDMAVAGVWIVEQALDGQIFNRHAVTTGNYEDINQREEMLTRNVDSISYRFKDYFDPFIGITNVTPVMRDVILGGINKLIRTLQRERVTPHLGGQLIDATVERFFISEVFKDRYVAYITMQVPYALNNIELHLIV